MVDGAGGDSEGAAKGRGGDDDAAIGRSVEHWVDSVSA